MLIYDTKTRVQTIRINGAAPQQIQPDDFKATTTISEDEETIKIRVDDAVKSAGYHMFVHVFSKPDVLSPDTELSTLTWVGPVGLEPRPLPGKQYWWEPMDPAALPEIPVE